MSDPEIHTWWPHLHAATKDLLDGIGDDPLPAEVLDEIAVITGRPVPEDCHLTAHDHDFIRTQREEVD
ncbi:hypothetical protein L2X99_00255 [Microbacterium sp. KUDC0406]|uniref:hypothetical protein n=1 Tax=Microbacterium sp. KUDC0406 TaxID=2909588 RepID=UPI001F455584|nr:hypothetical protein [Microbacterium sp. KUDC0406]UJP10198.1 hypothetical protein L2X99_00255 [Microbacterium sp. KUDC0406]